MNFKKLVKVLDATPKRNWRSSLTFGLTEGSPTEQNLKEFSEYFEGNAATFLVEGRVKIKGNECLAVKLEAPAHVNIKSSKESLDLIGVVEKDNVPIFYYRPSSGWKEGNKASDLK